MQRAPLLSLFITVFLLTPLAVRAQTSRILLCHGAGSRTEGVVKELPQAALGGHRVHGDCQISGALEPGAACDRSDPDHDGFCGVACTDPAGCGTGICGDSAGAGGVDIPCSCGNLVVTNTKLATADPVTSHACRDNGLTLKAGIQLDLNGFSVSGTNAGTGITIRSGGSLQGGTVQNFDVGVRVPAQGVAGSQVSVSGTTIQNNVADGAFIAVTDVLSRVAFDAVTVQGNGSSGIRVQGAPGSSNLDDATTSLARGDYGFTLGNPTQANTFVLNNGAEGIHLGDPTQPVDIAALIEQVEIHGNLKAGIVMEQKSSLLPGADCGASAGQPGCTGVTIKGDFIHNNGGPGVELHAGFIIPIADTGGSRLGFLSNEIAYNARPAGCDGSQTAPQIEVTGPVGLGDACGGVNSENACLAKNAPLNQHCAWNQQAGICTVAWDFSGICGTGTSNSIFGYVGNPSPSEVGLSVTGPSVVLATSDIWQYGGKYGQDWLLGGDPSAVVYGSACQAAPAICISAAKPSDNPVVAACAGIGLGGSNIDPVVLDLAIGVSSRSAIWP